MFPACQEGGRRDVVGLTKPARNEQLCLRAECSGLSRPASRATKPSSELYSAQLRNYITPAVHINDIRAK
jgi:hypothetical protein